MLCSARLVSPLLSATILGFRTISFSCFLVGFYPIPFLDYFQNPFSLCLEIELQLHDGSFSFVRSLDSNRFVPFFLIGFMIFPFFLGGLRLLDVLGLYGFWWGLLVFECVLGL
jgi:hypothetical protein